MTARLGVLVVGRLPNGRVEGIHLDTSADSAARITAARDTGRYVEVMAATVFERHQVKGETDE